jgi:hypothetical protein
MSNINEASDLQNRAAIDHEVATQHHSKAAGCHDKHKMSDGKESSKDAMGCCTTAQENSTSACAHTVK